MTNQAATLDKLYMSGDFGVCCPSMRRRFIPPGIFIPEYGRSYKYKTATVECDMLGYNAAMPAAAILKNNTIMEGCRSKLIAKIKAINTSSIKCDWSESITTD